MLKQLLHFFGRHSGTAEPKVAPPAPAPASADPGERTPKLQQALQSALEHHGAGRLAEAETAYRQIVDEDPENFDALQLWGVAALQSGRSGESAELIRRALAVDPDYAPAHYNLGNAYWASNRFDDAVASYHAAIALAPDHFEAHFNLGRLLHSRGDTAGALAHYQRAIAANPDLAEAHNFAGVIHGENGDLEAARRCFERALALDARIASAHYNLGNTQQDVRDALQNFDAALALDGEYVLARWARTMVHIPGVFDDAAEIAQVRTRFAAELDSLARWFDANPGRLDAGWQAVGAHVPFYLTYQNENNRNLLSQYGALCVRLMRHWQQNQPVPRPDVARSGRIRVGIVSAHIHYHSVWNAIVKGWVQHLDRSRFELFVFHIGASHDAQTELARARADYFDTGPRDLPALSGRIAAARLDAIIYPEIGMDAMTVKLASLRLAPVQAVSWGHPETSGLSTIDYFISAEAFETGPEGDTAAADAQENYTERLITLPRLGCCYERLSVDTAIVNLRSLGIASGVPLLIAPGTVYKYPPQHDWMFVEIARRLGKCQIVFVTTSHREGLSASLKRRLEQTFARAQLRFEDFVVFIPWQSPDRFHGLLRQAHVFLDTVGFSGFNTAMQAIDCGVPIVTRTDHFLRGRLAAGILRQLGLPELIAASDEEYIALAAKIAVDEEFRARVRNTYTEHRGALHNDVDSVRALETFLGEATASLRQAI